MATLKRRKKTLHARLYVPSDLHAMIGTTELTRSLGTNDNKVAHNRAERLQGNAARLWCVLRRDTTMEREQIEQLVSTYLDTLLDEAEASILYPREQSESLNNYTTARDAQASDIEERIASVEFALKVNEFDGVRPLAKQMLNGTASDQSLRYLCRRLLETQREALWAELRGLQGEPLPERSRIVSAPQATPKPSPLLSEAIAGYDRDVMSRWKARSATMGREGLAFFLGVVTDKPIGAVDANELRAYKGALRARKGRRGETLSAASITKHQSYVTGLFRWAEDGSLIDNNTAPKILKPEKSTVADDEQRDAFTDADLATIFGGDFEENKEKHPERYWFALLMLFTGARNEEVAQLYVDDVRKEQGVWCIDINADGPDKSLKNKFSKRLVPIHSTLIKRGFLKFVESMRTAGQSRVFANRTKTTKGYNVTLSRWFNRRLERLKVKTKRKDSYSLRHTFTTKVKEQGIAEYLIDQLTGHKTEGMSAGRYGKRVRAMDKLRDAVELFQVTL